MKKFMYIALLFGSFAGITSCEEDTPPPAPTPKFGSFTVEIEHVWAMNMAPFNLNTALYHPMTGDTLTFTTFKYYVSNIKLKRSDNTYWEEEESYHLVDASVPASVEIDLENVPAGDYVALEITMGVDSARNVSGAQTGALDPANGMFWSWNSGYIMIKAEGQSPQSSTGSFAYHLGGFTGPNKAVMVRELSFTSFGGVMTISQSANPQIHMLANPARLFHSYGSVSNGPAIHMPGVNAGKMAFDFQDWVKIDHIHN
jgi:hypothetical protein